MDELFIFVHWGVTGRERCNSDCHKWKKDSLAHVINISVWFMPFDMA